MNTPETCNLYGLTEGGVTTTVVVLPSNTNKHVAPALSRHRTEKVEKLLEDTIITDIRFVKTLARWLAGVFNFSSLPSSLMSDAS